ncbi:MAG: UbiA family prenyltransferase [Desulfobacteraceae bacterium]|nr:UbiA family prenyltransferase [Desulfobacteraceae bacterium]
MNISLSGAAPIKQQLTILFALSRTPHGVIDMAAPAAAALLCLGHFPALPVVIIGMVTVFAGYTAVYAINDLVDLRTDIEKVRIGGYSDCETYLDGVLIRHPMAKGMLSFKAGLFWALTWSAVALAGAFWLNPVCVYIFLTGCLLEAFYCKLWRVTPLRGAVNGLVKSLGPLAACFAVNPCPPVFFLICLFLWFFFWEIGGQNIPADWTDITEDRHFNAQTIPVALGLKRSSLLSLTCLATAMFFNAAVYVASALNYNGPFLLAIVLLNVFLLLKPAMQLNETKDRRFAMQLFNKASYYPLANLVLIVFFIIIR